MSRPVPYNVCNWQSMHLHIPSINLGVESGGGWAGDWHGGTFPHRKQNIYETAVKKEPKTYPLWLQISPSLGSLLIKSYLFL